MQTVRIGNRLIGPAHPAFIVAEIGINHNGDLDQAKKLISTAVDAGCDPVKFQKRSVDLVYTHEELVQPR
jgi:N-acetylneuraminate synthase